MKGKPRAYFDLDDNLRFDLSHTDEQPIKQAQQSSLISLAGSPHPEWDADTVNSEPSDYPYTYEAGTDAYTAVNPPLEAMCWVNPGMQIISANQSGYLYPTYSERVSAYATSGPSIPSVPAWVSVSSDTPLDNAAAVIDASNTGEEELALSDDESDDHGPYTTATPEPYIYESQRVWPGIDYQPNPAPALPMPMHFNHHHYLLHPSTADPTITTDQQQQQYYYNSSLVEPSLSYVTGLSVDYVSDGEEEKYYYDHWQYHQSHAFATRNSPSINHVDEMPAVLLQALSNRVDAAEQDLLYEYEDSDADDPPSDTGNPAESDRSDWNSAPMMTTKPVPSPESSPEPTPEAQTVVIEPILVGCYGGYSGDDTDDIEPTQVQFEVETPTTATTTITNDMTLNVLSDESISVSAEDLPGLVPEVSNESPLYQGLNEPIMTRNTDIDLSAIGIRVAVGPSAAAAASSSSLMVDMGGQIANEHMDYLRKIWKKTPPTTFPHHSSSFYIDDPFDFDLEGIIKVN